MALDRRNPTSTVRNCNERMPRWLHSRQAAQGSNCASDLCVRRERAHTAETRWERGSQCGGGGMRMRVHRSFMAIAATGMFAVVITHCGRSKPTNFESNMVAYRGSTCESSQLLSHPTLGFRVDQYLLSVQTTFHVGETGSGWVADTWGGCAHGKGKETKYPEQEWPGGRH